MSGMSVGLASMEAARWVANNVPRGAVALLKVGFPGWGFSSWQTVAAGQFRGLSGTRQDWTMEFVGFDGVLQSARPSAASFVPLFDGAGSETAIVHADSAGVPSTGLKVTRSDHARGFEKNGAVGAHGLIYCEPSSGTPFYVKWASVATDSVDSNPATFTLRNADVIDTTRVALTAGDVVTNIGYVSDQPRNVIKLLLSSGATSSLAGYGTLPADWGYKLDGHMFNESDLSRISSISNIDTTFVSDLIVSTPPDDPYATFRAWMRKLGYWLVWKENGISFRFAFDPTSSSADLAKHIVEEITDADIVSVDSFQLYAPDAPVEYQRYKAVNSYTAEAPLATAPGVYTYDNDSTAQIYDDPIGHATNRNNADTAINARLRRWYHRVPCSMELTLRGWHFATLVPGDYVRISSDMIPDMYAPSGTIENRAYMVTASAINWDGISTRITLATIPDKSTPTT